MGHLLRPKLIDELIEPVAIDPRSEPQRVRRHPEARRPRRLSPHPETRAQSVVDDGLHAPVGTPHFAPEQPLDIRFQGQCRSHGGIVMRGMVDVEMLSARSERSVSTGCGRIGSWRRPAGVQRSAIALSPGESDAIHPRPARARGRNGMRPGKRNRAPRQASSPASAKAGTNGLSEGKSSANAASPPPRETVLFRHRRFPIVRCRPTSLRYFIGPDRVLATFRTVGSRDRS